VVRTSLSGSIRRCAGALAVAGALVLVPLIGFAAPRPPVAPVEPVTDTYFGTAVVDPYRWMERGTTDPRFVPYLRAQSSYTTAVLKPLLAERNALRDRLIAVSASVARISDWQQAGGRLFFAELAPAATVADLRVRDLDGTTRVVFDPAAYAAATSHAAIDYFQPSMDGTHVVVGVSLGGSENDTIRVVETATGRVLPDTISRTQYGNPAWRSDGASFYYSRLQLPAPGAPPTAIYENQHVYLHVLGTDPEHDTAVFGPGVDAATAVPADGFNGVGTVPGQPYLIAFHSAGTTDPPTVYVGREGTSTWAPLIPSGDHIATTGASNIAIRGLTLFAVLQNVPNGRVLAYDLAHPSAPPTTVVPESSKIIEGVYGSAEALYVEYRNGLSFGISRMTDAGAHVADIALPYGGSLYGIDASPAEPGLRFGLDSWVRSPALFRYDGSSGLVVDTHVVPKDPFDVSHVVAREVLAPSTGGAMVPISIIVRDDIRLDGSHPTLFEGYGAYGAPIDPTFSATGLSWVSRGGVLAWAHVRGGGEYGERWHLAGQRATKQHTVDDMIATARYLIAHKYTSPRHLAVRGTSAGGIAVGGAIVQHPELFAAAVDNVGMTNILRFQQTQGGAANVPEFGDIASANDFRSMHPLDAYGRVKPGVAYPAVMGVTGLNDPRVPTWMVAKMIARLQAATSSGKPVVLRVDFDAGHGIGSSRSQALEERADEWTFLLWQLGDPRFQPR
jgi:prolyl oligopeptidase